MLNQIDANQIDAEDVLLQLEQELEQNKQNKKISTITSYFVRKHIGRLENIQKKYGLSRRSIYDILVKKGMKLSSFGTFSRTWRHEVEAMKEGKTSSLPQADPTPAASTAVMSPPIAATETDTSTTKKEEEEAEAEAKREEENERMWAEKNKHIWARDKVPPEIQEEALKQLSQDRFWNYMKEDDYGNPTFLNPETGAKVFLIMKREWYER